MLCKFCCLPNQVSSVTDGLATHNYGPSSEAANKDPISLSMPTFCRYKGPKPHGNPREELVQILTKFLVAGKECWTLTRNKVAQ